jgi:predicted glycosyltransferase
VPSPKKYDYLFLLSGPEPHHKHLREKMILLAERVPKKKCALVTSSFPEKIPVNLDVFCYPHRPKLQELVSCSEKIVCRSGYSTLMDLHLAGKKDLILVPTPGQTEQEYLGNLWAEKYGHACIRESQVLQHIQS